jgi:putative addiction module killer protein/probable addiction module antidote protein
MMTVIETRSFADWMANLKDLKMRARVAERLRRIAISGALGDHRDVGGGVGELRFHFGPGYRVYFCRRGAEIIILLGGGDKGSQSRDIKAAKALAKEVSPMVETREFDIQNYLKTAEERAAYIEILLEEGDPSFIASGLGEIARAIGVTEFSRRTGLSREAIYKGLVPGGNPTLETITKAARALGLQLTVKPAA